MGVKLKKNYVKSRGCKVFTVNLKLKQDVCANVADGIQAMPEVYLTLPLARDSGPLHTSRKDLEPPCTRL